MSTNQPQQSQPTTSSIGEPSQDSWMRFLNTVTESRVGHFIWRGQRDPNWPLASSFERRILQMNPLAGPEPPFTSQFLLVMDDYLVRFRERASRLVQINRQLSNIEWWAIGRHHGLTTRLLDWSDDPYVALAFALYDFLIANATVMPPNPHAQIAVYRLERHPDFDTHPPFDDVTSTDGLHILDLQLSEAPTIEAQNAHFTWLQSIRFFDIRTFLQARGQANRLTQILLRADQFPNAIRELNRHGMDYARLYPNLSGIALAANVNHMTQTIIGQAHAQTFHLPAEIAYLP